MWKKGQAGTATEAFLRRNSFQISAAIFTVATAAGTSSSKKVKKQHPAPADIADAVLFLFVWLPVYSPAFGSGVQHRLRNLHKLFCQRGRITGGYGNGSPAGRRKLFESVSNIQFNRPS